MFNPQNKLNRLNRFEFNLDILDDILLNSNYNYSFIKLDPDNYFTSNNKLFYKYKDNYLEIIPKEKIYSILDYYYQMNNGNIGRDRLFNLIKDHYIGISRRNINIFLYSRKNPN